MVPCDADATHQDMELAFESLPHFLQFLHASALRAEVERAELWWSREELTGIRKAFEAAADGSGCGPTARIFDVVRDLSFLQVRTCDADQQHVISDAARAVFNRKCVRPSIWQSARKSLAVSSKYSFEEMVRIVTISEQEWKRRV